jgi:hypothetical protein
LLGLISTLIKLKTVNATVSEKLFIYEKEIEQVDSFTYLRSIVSKDGGADEDVGSRIRKAIGSFIQLYPVWRNHNISKRTKLRIFNINVKSVLLYACETWSYPANHQQIARLC